LLRRAVWFLAIAALSGMMPSGAEALTWDITTVDGPGDVGAYASIALDSGENPGISYCASGSDDLKYAYRTGGVWVVETVDATGRTGWYTSLAFDAADLPCIAYWDLSNSALRFARWNGSVWNKETVDNSAYVGQCASLALDSAGLPSISYYDYTNGDLRYARFDGSVWHIEVLDDGAPLMGAGLYTSLALDSQDRPHISYADHTTGRLRYAGWDGAAWTLETVDGGTPIGTSIRLDSNGVPHISYAYQYGQGSHLKYAARTGDGGTWQVRVARFGGQVGLYSSLRLRSDAEPCILSWDLGNSIVDYDCFVDGAWSHDTVETMGFTDQWCALALNGAGEPLAAYRSSGEADLHFALGAGTSSVAGEPARVPVDPLRIFPNPVASGGRIQLSLPEGASVVRWFDAQGREAAPPAVFEAGPKREANWDAGRLGPGVYFAVSRGRSGEHVGRVVVR